MLRNVQIYLKNTYPLNKETIKLKYRKENEIIDKMFDLFKYANAQLFFCNNPKCQMHLSPRTEWYSNKYESVSFLIPTCEICGEKMIPTINSSISQVRVEITLDETVIEAIKHSANVTIRKFKCEIGTIKDVKIADFLVINEIIPYEGKKQEAKQEISQEPKQESKKVEIQPIIQVDKPKIEEPKIEPKIEEKEEIIEKPIEILVEIPKPLEPKEEIKKTLEISKYSDEPIQEVIQTQPVKQTSVVIARRDNTIDTIKKKSKKPIKKKGKVKTK
jgi:hypothetical protein